MKNIKKREEVEMKKSLKKAFALLLALAVIFATFKTAPASSAEAKGSTKYSASKVYISPDYLSGYETDTVWKSVPKIRTVVYYVDQMYVYYGDLAAITDVKVKGKGLVAEPDSGNIAESNLRQRNRVHTLFLSRFRKQMEVRQRAIHLRFMLQQLLVLLSL